MADGVDLDLGEKFGVVFDVSAYRDEVALSGLPEPFASNEVLPNKGYEIKGFSEIYVHGKRSKIGVFAIDYEHLEKRRNRRVLPWN